MGTFNRSEPLYKYGNGNYTRVEVTKIVFEEAKRYPPALQEQYINEILTGLKIRNEKMSKSTERKIAFGTGIFFLLGMLFFSVLFPNPSRFQYFICRLILSLAAGFTVHFISGFLTVDLPFGVRAGGGLGAFAAVYFLAPAALGPVEA